MPTLNQDLRKLRSLKLKYEKTKDAKEKAEREFKDYQSQVFGRMQSEETESQKVAGVLFVPTETVYATVQDRSEFVAWAKDNDDELIQDRERKELLNALVRAKLDNGEPLPPGVGFFVREYISQRAG